MPRTSPNPPQHIIDEINAVTGARCGHRCDAHGLACVRAPEHLGAVYAVDVHATLVDGAPVLHICVCPAAVDG